MLKTLRLLKKATYCVFLVPFMCTPTPFSQKQALDELSTKSFAWSLGFSWRALGKRSNRTIARVRPSGKTQKETFSKRPPESSNNPCCPPLPLPKRLAPATSRLPSLSGEGLRGSKATVYWDKSRTSSEEP